MNGIANILNKKEFSKEDIIYLLSVKNKDDQSLLFQKAFEVKLKNIGKNVYLRGLIELSNQCKKNCLYCGIRGGNEKVNRYAIPDDEVIEVAKYAQKLNFNSIVFQSGERSDSAFVERISNLIKKVKEVTNPQLRLTLSVGEQSFETYKNWFNAGAERYLLRIESSNKNVYNKIHPNDELHSYDIRLKSLENVKKAGFQTGTGIMIGLPFQTVEDLADDLLYIKKLAIDMVGMGPYIEHADTPLYQQKDNLLPIQERLELALRMIAVLRLIAPTINIVSTTALETIATKGREFGLKVGANVIMPNLTPLKYRESYLLYDNKPYLNEVTEESMKELTSSIRSIGQEIAWDEFGDSIHYLQRNKKN